MSFKTFAKETAVIGLAMALTGVGNFLLLPLVSKTLGTQDYGRWIQISVTVMLLSQLVLLQLQMSLVRSLSSTVDKGEIRSQFYTLFSFITLVGFSVAAVIIAVIQWGGGLGISMEPGTVQPFTIAALLVPLMAYGALTTAYFMARGRFKTYALLNLLNSFGQLSLALVLLTMGLQLLGVVLAAVMASVLAFSIAFILIVADIGLCWPHFHLLKPNLRFSLPLTPTSLLTWVTDSSDRYFVALMLGIGVTGIYSAAYGIGAVVFVLIIPIQIVLYPTISRLYDHGQIGEVKTYLSRSLRYFLMVAIPAVVGMAALSEPLLVALTTPDFAAGAVVIPFVALAGLFSGALTIVTTVLFLVKKTHLHLITFAVPAIVNVALVLLLTPTIGIMGTALATTIAYALMLVMGAYFSFRFIRFSMSTGFIGKCVASATCMVVAIVLIRPTTMLDILLSVGIGTLVYFASLYLFRGFEPDEIEAATSMLGSPLKKMLRR